MNHSHALARTNDVLVNQPPDLCLAVDNTGTITILDSKPSGIVLSASQIDVWDRCKRRWSYEYIWKIRTPSHPSAILGGKVHGHLEGWLDTSLAPPFDEEAGEIATAMISALPLPGTGVVERRFWFRTPLGHVYTGFIDWSGVWQDADDNYILATILDHKTSGNLNWAKTPEDLHNDIQAVLYSVVGFVGFNTDVLRLFWNYGSTKKKRGAYPTKTVKTHVQLPVVMAKFNNVIEPEAAQMIAHREAETDPMAFPVSPQSCGDFGGCPHKHRCNLSPMQLLGATMHNQQTMQERMAQQPANGATMNQPLPGQQPMPGQPAALPGQPPQQQPQALPQQALPGQPPQQVQTTPVQTMLPGQPMQPGMPGVQQQLPQQPVSAPPVQALPGQPPQGALPGQPPQGALPGQMAPNQPAGQLPGQMAPNQPAGQLPGQMAPATLPGQPPQGALPGQQAAPQQPYAPDVAPNPPETTQPQPPAEEVAAAKGPGRPAGAKNKAKTLTVEQQVYMGGVYAAMGNAVSDHGALANAGETAVTLFHQKFG